MKSTLTALALTSAMLSAAPSASDTIILENGNFRRTIHTKGTIATTSLLNKLDGKTLTPTDARAFVIHLKGGKTLTPSDFSIRSQLSGTRSIGGKPQTVTEIVMSSEQPAAEAKLVYRFGDGDPYCRKSLEITPANDLEVTRIDLESLNLPQAYQPYTLSQITS